MIESQDAFQQAMNQGHSAAWDQNWDKAASFYRQALEVNPDHPQALTNLGLALIELQSYDEALDCYWRAAEIQPEDPLPLEKIAQLSERLGDLDTASQSSLKAAEVYLKNREVNKALENWERVTRLTPENLKAHSRLAQVYERLGEKQKAVTEYLAVASLMQSGGDLEKALRSIKQAMKVNPNSEQALQALNLLKDFKQLPKPSRPRGGTAPIRMSKVRQLHSPQANAQPELDPIAQANQTAMMAMAGMLFEGLEVENGKNPNLRAVLSDTGSLQEPIDWSRMTLYLSRVVDLETQGEFSKATAELQRAMDMGLNHPAAHFNLGFLYYQGGRLESAARQVHQVVSEPEYALGARLLLADLYHKKNQTKEASIEYLEALKLADAEIVPPEQASDLMQLYEPLIDSYQQQSTAEIQNQLCETVRDLLRRADWKAQLRRARGQLPNQDGAGPPLPLAEILTEARSSQVIESISKIYEMVRKEHYRSAMEEAFYTLQDAPTYLPLHSLMADMLVEQQDIQRAVKKLQVIAKTYRSRGEPQQAINIYRKIVELSPADIQARNLLINLLIDSRETDVAIEEYINLAEVYYNLADLKMARETYTQALKTAQQANLDRSVRVKIMHKIADIDMQSLDWRQALRIYDQIRTLMPEDLETRTQLIEINLRLGQETQALSELDKFISHLISNNKESLAVVFLEELAGEHPNHIPVRRRLADLYKQVGRTADAIHQLDAIGELLLKVGDRGSAIQTVEMILALDPPNRRDYQQLLDQLRSG